jgi:hypothetical protein
MQYILTITCVVILGWAHAAYARPVSYPTGWTVMQMNDADTNALHVHYSPTARYSIGYKVEYWRDEEWQFHGAQLNYLIKRWNRPASQANLYMKSGFGVAYSDFDAYDGITEPAAFTGFAADWEDRRYFTSYEARAFEAGNIDRFFMQKARVGIAPYIGEYGDIHTWLMLEAKHTPSARDNVTLTPLIRIFKSETLAEFGVSDQGNILFNWTLRF